MKLFYLKHYRALHHILTIFMIFIINYFFFGLTELFTSLPIQFLFLILSYFICEYSLKKSGLNDAIKEEIEKEENKKENKKEE